MHSATSESNKSQKRKAVSLQLHDDDHLFRSAQKKIKSTTRPAGNDWESATKRTSTWRPWMRKKKIPSTSGISMSRSLPTSDLTPEPSVNLTGEQPSQVKTRTEQSIPPPEAAAARRPMSGNEENIFRTRSNEQQSAPTNRTSITKRDSSFRECFRPRSKPLESSSPFFEHRKDSFRLPAARASTVYSPSTNLSSQPTSKSFCSDSDDSGFTNLADLEEQGVVIGTSYDELDLVSAGPSSPPVKIAGKNEGHSPTSPCWTDRDTKPTNPHLRKSIITERQQHAHDRKNPSEKSSKGSIPEFQSPWPPFSTPPSSQQPQQTNDPAAFLIPADPFGTDREFSAAPPYLLTTLHELPEILHALHGKYLAHVHLLMREIRGLQSSVRDLQGTVQERWRTVRELRSTVRRLELGKMNRSAFDWERW